MDFLVGTFNTSQIYTLRFTPSSNSLTIIRRSPAIGSHSFLALSASNRNLYATAWLEPPSIVAYRVHREEGAAGVSLLNQKPIASRSGYVACSETHIYSAGGPSGEVFSIDAKDGSISEMVQTLSFVDDNEGGEPKSEDRPHGDFGGLRHGAHSVDLSPDGKRLFVADIGRNCVWTFNVDTSVVASSTGKNHLLKRTKCAAPRPTDGPRHTIPHPNGRVLYTVQEHTSMVDAFLVGSFGKEAATTLRHKHGVSILPHNQSPEAFWADEVRVSHILHEGSGQPKYLWASTRGLKSETKGYIAVYPLDENGWFASTTAIHIWETPTSGGIANAIEPAPGPVDGVEYAALTDTEEGFVFVVAFNGKLIKEAARLKLTEEGDTDLVKAATAVWL